MKYSVKVFMLLAIHFLRFFYKTHPIQFSLFPNHLLPKLIGCVPAMNKIESQSPMLLCSKFGWIWPSGLDSFENVKSKQTEKRTDSWCRREYQKSSHRILFKWAKKNPINFIECFGWYYEVTSNDFTMSMICQVNI